jgi:hypothetical protein
LYQFDKKGENNPYQTEHDELFAAIAKGVNTNMPMRKTAPTAP